MRTPNFLIRTCAILGLAASAAAQDQFLWMNQRADGTVWAQSLAPKLTAGSAELGTIDLGPPTGPGITGIQSTWLEWNQTNVYLGLLGGGIASAEVTQPPGTGAAPIAGCLGAATFHGGYVVTELGGSYIGVAAQQGAFLWNSSNLYLFALGGAIATEQVTTPTLAPIANVQGVSIIHSFAYDYDPTVNAVLPAIRVSALVYTPSNVYHVFVVLSGGIAFTTTEVSAPGGGPIAFTRGVAAFIGETDFSVLPAPPIDIKGAALIWDDAHVYLFSKSPVLGITEVFTPLGAPIASCWGAMRLGRGEVVPVLRGTAFIWQPGQAWVLALEPGLTVAEATLPPGLPSSAPLVSNVSVPGGGLTPLVERQAGSLYEILGTMMIGGLNRRALVIGQSQRTP